MLAQRPPAHAPPQVPERRPADLHLWGIDPGELAQERGAHVAGRLREGEWRLRGGPEWGWEAGREKAGVAEGAAVGVKASGSLFRQLRLPTAFLDRCPLVVSGGRAGPFLPRGLGPGMPDTRQDAQSDLNPR